MKRIHFNGGADGAALNAGATPGGLGDVGSVSISGAGSGTIRTSAAIRGARGLHVVAEEAGTDIYTVALTDTANESGRAQIYFTVDSARPPVAAAAVLVRLRSASANAAIVVLNTSRILIVQNAAGSGLKNFNSNTALPDGDYYVTLAATRGTGATDGTIKAWLRKASDDTLVDSYSATNVNAGTANITTAQTGKPVSQGTVDIDLDEFAFETGSVDEIPAVPANQSPTADAGADQTVEPGHTVTLSGSGSSDPDGSITSYAWTQISGTPTVTLSGSDATRTFVAPATLAGVTLGFELTVTDNGGATHADTVSVQVLPASIHLMTAGGIVPAVALLKT